VRRRQKEIGVVGGGDVMTPKIQNRKCLDFYFFSKTKK
jgi:hypothetical protein